MKAERFTAGGLWIERARHREGPPVVYTVMIKESSRPFTEHKAILKFAKAHQLVMHYGNGLRRLRRKSPPPTQNLM